MSFSAGGRLGPYELVELIGAGGMGEVWKARDTRLNRLVAIKRLKSPAGRRFEQEAQAIAALNHHHICQIHDIGPGYLVLEYIEGKPLQGPLSVEEALRLAKQIAGALDEAHRRGIIHRDLKPANILVTPNGSVKLLDFGIARLLSDADSQTTQTIDGMVMGTPAYMSPEQAQGKPADERADVFAFGAVLYEMLSGSRAFGGFSTADVLSAVLRDEPRPLEAPPAIQRLLGRCLAKQPPQRFQTMADVRAALEQIQVAPSTGAANAPATVTRLIGRHRELAEVRELLLRDDIRFVNLTGPPGVGKTSLAIAVLHEMAGDFANSWFIGLEGVVAPSQVPSAILYALKLREEDARPARTCLIEHLEQQSGLLVLDNFEQVADAAPLLQELVTSCPLLRILITSRSLLRLRAEREYMVGPLAVSGPAADLATLLQMPAVALFLDRAPTIQPTLETVQAVAEICERLDGLPLAIELAAARSKLLSPQAILARLRNRFQLLGRGARDSPERQQTLRHAIDWSYELLTLDERGLLQRLSVFVQGGRLESVEAICRDTGGDMLDQLSGLADKSLLVKQEDQKGNLRIRLLETIREYAGDRFELAHDAATIRARHAAHYLALAEQDVNWETSPDARAALYDLLEEDQSNCLAALDWFLTKGEQERALRMAAALWPFWEARGYWTVGREQLKHVLTATDDTVQAGARAKALYAAGVLADAQGDYTAARAAFEQHLALQRTIRNPAALATATNNLGIVAFRQGDLQAAALAYREALEILRSLDSQLGVAQCLNNLGHVAMAKGDYANARRNYQESLAICCRCRSTRDTAWTLSNLGDVAREEAQFAEAENLYSQSLRLFRDDNDQAGLARSMSDLGDLTALRGQYVTAAQLYQESLVIFGELGDRRGIARVLEGFATLASGRGRAEEALQLAAAAAAIRKSLGVHVSHAQRLRLDKCIAAARATLGPQADRAWSEGERMPVARALAYALASATV